MSEPIEPGTKLPWRQDSDKPWEVTNSEGEAIAATFSDNGWGLADSNAAYIVHACNSYPQLESKLAELEKLLKLSHDWISAAFEIDVTNHVEIAHLRDNIAKALEPTDGQAKNN